jgi:hypothetical protein
MNAHPQASFRIRLGLLFASGLALACREEDEPACDSSSELRVTYGSDIAGREDETVCDPLPAACGATPSCDCLRGHTLASGVSADFCIDDGACDDADGELMLECPGG